ncbi:MAG: sulfotransferase family protein [Acidimicrobiia bacterium]
MALDGLRARVPLEWRHRLARQRLRLLVPTGRWRALPDALLIGAQRAGTSSLYRWLGAHPGVAPSFRKEVEYFSRYWPRGEDWYRAHFELQAGRRHLRFEATPDYLFHPLAAARAASVVPDARIVVLLRDPVERAWSQYRHMVRLGYETLAFPDALAAEQSRCAGDIAALAADPDHDAKALLLYSYAARGHYADQLARWYAAYPEDRMLVLRSVDLFGDPAGTYATLLAFLGLDLWSPPAFRNVSSAPGRGSAPAIDTAARRRLEAEYAADDRTLWAG